MGKPYRNGSKKKVKRKGPSFRKKQPVQLNTNNRKHFVVKPLSNFEQLEWVKKLKIKYFSGIYSRDELPNIIKKECGIINLDDKQGPGTHWVCYRNIDSVVEYLDPFGLITPNEALKYFNTSGKHIVYSLDEIQNRNSVFLWLLVFILSIRKTKRKTYFRYYT